MSLNNLNKFAMMIAIGVMVTALTVQAAVLTYPMGYSQDNDNPDIPAGTAGASVSSTYGDNITQADIDAGYYGEEGGPTPDVLVWNDYENIYVKVSDDGYGDLESVLCSTYSWYMIEFKTDDNHLIDLHGFDMAVRASTGGTAVLDLLLDGSLVNRISADIYGQAGSNGRRHVSFDTSEADGSSGIYGFGELSGRHLGIRIWTQGMGDDLGITNIHFSQSEGFVAFDASPADGTTGVSLATSDLSWNSHDNVVYDVWVGTTADLAGVTPLRVSDPSLALNATALPLGELDPNATYYWRVDTVQADDTVTTGDLWSFTTVPGQVTDPAPLSGSVRQSCLGGQLSWTGPDGWEAVEACYEVYLGQDAENLAKVTPSEPLCECAWTLQTSLEALTTYYWRVDTLVHGQTFTGDVWSFDTAAAQATSPLPTDGGSALSCSSLRWISGASALSHRVYVTTEDTLYAQDLVAEVNEAEFALDVNDVNNAAWVPGQTYTWRVDEVAVDGTVVTGQTWTFTVQDLPVDGLVVALTPETALTNGDCVESWRDLSGHNNDALMFDQETRPWLLESSDTDSMVVDFDGVDDHLIIASNPEDFDRNTFTWFIVGIPMDESDTMAFISSGYEEGSCAGWINRLWGTAWEDSTWITWIKSPGKVSVVSNGSSHEVALVSGLWNGDNLWQYLDSVSSESVGSGSTGNPESHQFTLLGSGFARAGKGNYLYGQIAEVWVYNTELTSDDKAAVDSYLAAKYGFEVEIPTHPSPLENAKHVDRTVTLSWEGPQGSTYDVFFKEADASDWTQVADQTSETEVCLYNLDEPIMLDYEKQYQWRVDMWINGVRLKGTEWSFETWIPYCSEEIQGDLNGDCKVDTEDLLLLLANWLQSN